jgi:transcriptional regulator with XRE-family HTH domain
METFEIIKSLRTESGLTQEQLAKIIGFSPAAIGPWENGKQKPAADALIALAKHFNVSADYILGLEKDDGSCALSIMPLSQTITAQQPKEERDLLSAFRLLNSGQQKYELGRIQALAGIDLEEAQKA